jgi:hypothetical protein
MERLRPWGPMTFDGEIRIGADGCAARGGIFGCAVTC